MPKTITIPPNGVPADVTPGLYSYTIDTPTRSDRARITLTRPVDWPAGAIFTYTVYERERNGLLVPLTGATENGTGGPIIGRGGVVNPPLIIEASWPLDKDKDQIQFQIQVIQTFQTVLTVEFF